MALKHSPLQKWVIATRLETTLLALTSVALGSALAAYTGTFDAKIGLLAAVTASLLQVTCNLANDYGDLVHGADALNTIKAPSALQTSLITFAQARKALWGLLIATAGCGLLLLYMAKLPPVALGSFLLLGILAIAAALTYTLGSQPYGYQGGGDLAVFLFFGLIGVGGTFYLHTQQLRPIWLLPAISYGSLVVGVLNVNNLRDLTFDTQVGKNTLPVRIGREAAIYYHWSLLSVSIGTMVGFLWSAIPFPTWPYACLCLFPWLVRHGIAVSRLSPTALDQQLLVLVFLAFAWGMLLSIGLCL